MGLNILWVTSYQPPHLATPPPQLFHLLFTFWGNCFLRIQGQQADTGWRDDKDGSRSGALTIHHFHSLRSFRPPLLDRRGFLGRFLPMPRSWRCDRRARGGGGAGGRGSNPQGQKTLSSVEGPSSTSQGITQRSPI